jgi:4-alpha-glucanotransferase
MNGPARRQAGILLPLSALPSRFGVGDFGDEAYRFVDLISEMGFSLWEILPLNPIGYGHSPYQPFSSFAMDEIYVSLDALLRKGLIKEAPSYYADAPKVFYEDVRSFKAPYLHEAYEAEMKRDPHCLDAFVSGHDWAENWGIFMSLKRSEGMRPWNEWPQEKKDALSRKESLLDAEKEAARYEIWVQKTLYEQWSSLHEHALKKGVRIIGDVPFYVGFDSLDVYEDNDDFLLDPETKEPTFVAGVPPDYFSATGQRWGNPIYDWDRLKGNGFAFIMRRFALNAKIYDVIRLDHFRAFDTYWKIPASCPTAVGGEWVEAPGYEFFDLLLEKHPEVRIIAEDLGMLRPEVLALRDHYGFPGMNVVQFNFEDSEFQGKEIDRPNSVAYLGTHDNETMRGFLEHLGPEREARWMEALSKKGFSDGTGTERLISYCLSLEADTAIICAQDILGLDDSARINVPGVIDDVNWTWRLISLDGLEAKKGWMRELIGRSGRL